MTAAIPAPRSILIVRTSALGDVARSVPVLAALRAGFPQARIDWLVQTEYLPIVAHHPALTNALAFPRKRLVSGLPALRRALREPRYDLAIDCQGLLKSAVPAWLSGAPVRIGHADPRERAATLFYTRTIPTKPGAHTVEKMLGLVEALGVAAPRDPAAMRLHAPPDARAWIDAHPWAREPYVLLAPTSAHPAKEWPAERFADVARRCHAAGVRTVTTGVATDRERLGPLLAACDGEGGVDLVGKTGVSHLMALVERAAVVVCNDSAAAHIAVGFDRPLVALLGPTDPSTAGPFGRGADVVQHVEPGDDLYFRDGRSAGMIRRITSDEVWERLVSRLG
jgi:lipopolysaccharide heptosyltransferase I